MPKRCPKCDMVLPEPEPQVPPRPGAVSEPREKERCPNCGEEVLEEVPENENGGEEEE